MFDSQFGYQKTNPKNYQKGGEWGGVMTLLLKVKKDLILFSPCSPKIRSEKQILHTKNFQNLEFCIKLGSNNCRIG
jgi:hypothetical protein